MWENVNKLFYPNARKANRQYRKQFFNINIDENQTLHQFTHKIEEIATTSNSFITSNYRPTEYTEGVSEMYYGNPYVHDTKKVSELRKATAAFSGAYNSSRDGSSGSSSSKPSGQNIKSEGKEGELTEDEEHASRIDWGGILSAELKNPKSRQKAQVTLAKMGYFLSSLITLDDNLTVLYSALESRSPSTFAYLAGQPHLTYGEAKDYALQHCSPEAEEDQLNAIRNDNKKSKQRTQCATCKRFHKGPCWYKSKVEAEKDKEKKKKERQEVVHLGFPNLNQIYLFRL